MKKSQMEMAEFYLIWAPSHRYSEWNCITYELARKDTYTSLTPERTQVKMTMTIWRLVLRNHFENSLLCSEIIQLKLMRKMHDFLGYLKLIIVCIERGRNQVLNFPMNQKYNSLITDSHWLSRRWYSASIIIDSNMTTSFWRKA